MPNNEPIFPTDMTASSLTVDYRYLMRRAARILGLPTDFTRMTSQHKTEVDEVIAEGLRMFYNPPVIDPFGKHEWSFLTPIAVLETEASKQWYDLPPDFSHIDSEVGFTYADSHPGYPPIRLSNEALLMRGESALLTTAYPMYAAIRPKNVEGRAPQRYEVGFFPEPNASYRLRYRYHAMPHMLSDDEPYPLGGNQFGQAILAAVEAAAEMYEMDGRGPYYQKFIEELRSAIQEDSRQGPVYVGRNVDVYRRWYPGRRSDRVYQNSVTYNGRLWNS